jgi:hypothetical protein
MGRLVEGLKMRVFATVICEAPFLNAGSTPAGHHAGIEHAITKGWLWRHESGFYVKFASAWGRAARLRCRNRTKARLERSDARQVPGGTILLLPSPPSSLQVG